MECTLSSSLPVLLILNGKVFVYKTVRLNKQPCGLIRASRRTPILRHMYAFQTNVSGGKFIITVLILQKVLRFIPKGQRSSSKRD